VAFDPIEAEARSGDGQLLPAPRLEHRSQPQKEPHAHSSTRPRTTQFARRRRRPEGLTTLVISVSTRERGETANDHPQPPHSRRGHAPSRLRARRKDRLRHQEMGSAAGVSADDLRTPPTRRLKEGNSNDQSIPARNPTIQRRGRCRVQPAW